MFIKRIVGLSGDSIPNPWPVTLTAHSDGRHLTGHSGRCITIPTNCVFVVGDNLFCSSDSRIWGPIPEKGVCGKMIMKIS